MPIYWIVNIPGVTTGSSSPSDPSAIEVPFIFASAFPLALTALSIGDTVRRIAIEIETPFNVGVDFTMGSDQTTPTEIFGGGTILATITAVYQFHPYRDSIANENLILSLFAGVPTTGSGKVYIET